MATNRNDKDMFKGTIDEFLESAAKLNVDELYKDLEKKECIAYIMKHAECDNEEEAHQVYEEICMQDTKETLDLLIEKGLVEITSYDETGEPLYTLTKKGKERIGRKDLED